MAEITKEQLAVIEAARKYRFDPATHIVGARSLFGAVDALIESEKPKEVRPPGNKKGWYWLQWCQEDPQPIEYDGAFWKWGGGSGYLHTPHEMHFRNFRYIRPCK